MKKRTKIIIISAVAVLLAAALFPVKLRYKDGGSVGYKSLVYEVIKLNALGELPNERIVGTVIKLFGNEIYRNEETVKGDYGDTADQPGSPRDEDASLRFWILDDISGVDMSGLQATAMFGGDRYVEDKYPVVTDEGGYNRRPPEVAVSYTVTAWPDYADGGRYVTRIDISDPGVSVFGVTMNSDEEEFKREMERRGLTVQSFFDDEEPENFRFALRAVSETGGYEICLHKLKTGEAYFYINAPVSNRDGIVF